MRRTFADILNSAEVDVAAEYRSLHMLVYERGGFCADMEEHFGWMPFAGTAYNLRDFNNRNGFDFEECKSSDDLDYLLCFCEYVYNFATRLNCRFDYGSVRSSNVIRHIIALTEKIRYRFVQDGGLWVLVLANERIVAAAEVAPKAAGNDLFRYDYRGYKGDLEGKRKILSTLAMALEPYRSELVVIAKQFSCDYFCLVNNLNIRHNNVDPADSRNYKELITLMPADELEEWYDTVRDMSAAAFLLLEYKKHPEDIGDLKRG